MKSVNDTFLFWSPVVDTEVTSVFLGLKNNGSCVADGIHIMAVKYVLDLILPRLTYRFNICLSGGDFPERMQLTKVTVLRKKRKQKRRGN